MVEISGVKIYSVAEVVKLIGICDRVVKEEIERGNLKATKRAGRFWISENSILEYLTAETKSTRRRRAKKSDSAAEESANEEERAADEE